MSRQGIDLQFHRLLLELSGYAAALKIGAKLE